MRMLTRETWSEVNIDYFMTKEGLQLGIEVDIQIRKESNQSRNQDSYENSSPTPTCLNPWIIHYRPVKPSTSHLLSESMVSGYIDSQLTRDFPILFSPR